MVRMVPNPLRAALEDALKMVEPLVQEIEKSIEKPYREFHSDNVWTGPAGKRFGEQFTHHRKRVSFSTDRILSDLRQTLAIAPRQVTEEEAKVIKKRYGLP